MAALLVRIFGQLELKLTCSRSFIDTDNELKGGRLGVLTTPTPVTSLKEHFLVDVSCGVSHTAVLSAVETDTANGAKGGVVYVCGSAHSLGKFCPAFVALPQLQGVPVSNVSCGNAHTAAVSVDGEVYTWGNNTGGCTGHTLVQRFVKVPTRLPCMYQMPQNMARNPHYNVVAVQSSVNSGYSVDLGVNCRLDTIRIWNRTGNDGLRLFPLVVMVSESPYEAEGGKFMLRTCKAQSVWTKFSADCAAQNPLVWRVPQSTLGRYVRLQLDATNLLSLAQVEVLGVEDYKCIGPKGASVACGDDVTMVVCRPSVLQSDIDTKFLRALCADIDHLHVLNEYHTFAPCIHKFTDLRPHLTSCLLCTAQHTCPICILFQQIPASAVPPDIRTTTSLDKFSTFLLSHRPPRAFEGSAAAATMVRTTEGYTDDETRLLQIAVNDEKPESELTKAGDMIFSTVHKAVTSTAQKVQPNPTIQPIHAAAADNIQKFQDQARPMSQSFLRKAMASSKETWQKYTSGKPKDKATGNEVIRVQPKEVLPPDDTGQSPPLPQDASARGGGDGAP
ncbi:hypothetical protein B5M09_005196 [Aphanomyces astaci]|uniref:Uncharacterized protein n=1 Tax=Aphanomyces astaci TaxID=112090 RepID=A0A425D8P4_APHAT|nr:hypothetical protein B5M09_005196 [Aphanomyces astaci]